ncbi:YhfG family protein [Pseudomonas sp. Irchel s3a10]|uniref:YhfG family protein n=1 Tax=Pseudomonas TaxID=286 RepID=UPI001AA0DAD9|nr:YhfG family protein [Pseudomonas koreensis]
MTFQQKQACYEKVCRSNYLASLRIEGFETVPANAAESLPDRQQILDRYRHNTS